MIVHVENSMKSSEKLLELLSELDKILEYKTTTQKSAEFLQTSNMQLE